MADPIVNTFNSVVNAVGSSLKAPDQSLEKAKANCRAKGGTWDAVKNVCIMPTPQEKKAATTKETIPDTKNPPNEAFRDSQTGDLSGFTKDGKTFLGASPEAVRAEFASNQANTQLPQGVNQVGTAANQAEQQQRIQHLVQLAQQGLITPEELQRVAGSGVDIQQALGAGALSAAPGIVGGALTGLAAGAIGGSVVPGPGTAIGAALGAVGGFLIGVRNSIKSQQSDQFANDKKALTKGQTYLRSLITDTNRNPQNAPENIALFYQTLNMIDIAHAKAYKDSQEDLNRFLGNDGTKQLQEFEVFDTTMRQYYITSFNTALAQPNPMASMITAEDITSPETD